eukprot:gene51510-68929_t
MYKLVLIRHGESTWNLENRFTGWTDVPLTDTGVAQARAAGELLKEAGLVFDVAYTSVLKRAIRTLWLSLDEMDMMYLPIKHDWRLNERHYGVLQGLDKGETAAKYGDEQVLVWRRSFTRYEAIAALRNLIYACELPGKTMAKTASKPGIHVGIHVGIGEKDR